MCLGVVNARSNGVVASTFGRERPHLTQTLVNFAKRYVPGFKFSSIQVNKNYLSGLHVDKNNLGPSYISERAVLAASVLAAVLTEICLCASCSCPGMLRSATARVSRRGRLRGGAALGPEPRLGGLQAPLGLLRRQRAPLHDALHRHPLHLHLLRAAVLRPSRRRAPPRRRPCGERTIGAPCTQCPRHGDPMHAQE
jgi:hypothetical protein